MKTLYRSDMPSYPIFFRLLKNLSDAWVEEYRFHPTRRWRFDFARPDIRLAIEIDGGVWSGGRHSGGAGQIKDMEKGNAAVALGWQILHFTPQQAKNNEAYRLVHFMHHRTPDEHHPTTTIKKRQKALEPKS